MEDKSIQDAYPDDLSHCYGCGRLNESGLQLKSYWRGDESVAVFQPRSYHIGVPGFVYGGLLASIIDCHGTGTAAAASYRAEDRKPGTAPALRFVTASLQVDYLRPTPLGPPLELRGRVTEMKGRKVVVQVTVAVEGKVCVRGEVVAVKIPQTMMPADRTSYR